MTVLINNFEYTSEKTVNTGLLLTIVNNFDYSNQVLTDTLSEVTLEDHKLTQYCMDSAAQSFAEDWGNEDDNHWNSFLK
jgi:hypothetical protein